MTASAAPAAAGEFIAVPLRDVEQELARQLKAAQQPGQPPLIQARMANLVIFCPRADLAEGPSTEIPTILAAHPARVLLLIGEAGADAPEVAAAACVSVQRRGQQLFCSEQVTLRARTGALERLPFAVRTLLIGDLPTNLWWASPQPPALAGPLVYELAEYAQQLVYDSHGWADPHRGVAATASWLERFERRRDQGRWRVASDLNWRRLKSWRRALGQALDPASAPGALDSISDVLVEHGPHAVTQAWQLVGWLASRLGWHVLSARVQPGVEIAWRVYAPHGTVRLRIRRLAEGPSEVRSVRVACTLQGKPGALNLVVEDERRLAVVPEGMEAAPRTLTLQRQPRAELLSRQLRDREPDPVFRESMAVAQVFAQSILR